MRDQMQKSKSGRGASVKKLLDISEKWVLPPGPAVPAAEKNTES